MFSLQCIYHSFIVFFIIFFCCSDAQQVGNTSLLSGFWNSLTSVEQVSTCPGECVHAITSIFCDKVLDHVSCNDSYLRCCVMNPVLGMNTPSSQEISTTLSSIIDDDNQIENMTVLIVPIRTLSETYSESTNQMSFSTENNKAIIAEEVLSDSELENFQTTKPITITSLQNCPVPCSQIPENSFCIKNLSDVECPQGQECCLEIESSIDTMTRNLIKLVQETVARNESLNIGHGLVAILEGDTTSASRTNPVQNIVTTTTEISPKYSDSITNSESLLTTKISTLPSSSSSSLITTTTTTTTTTTESSLPPCSGTCVVALFSILCDSTDDQQYCPNGGTCCVNREMTTPIPTIGLCQGTCIPVILSGMCNKPYELVLKTTDCSSSTICCADKKNDFDEETLVDKESLKPPSEINPLLSSPQNSRLPYRPNHPFLPNQQQSHHSHSQQQPHPVLRPGNQFVGHRLKPHPSMNDIHFGPESKPSHHHAIYDDTIGRIPQRDTPTPLFSCPGSCMNTMFRFACLGQNSIYTAFYCAKGQVCCAPNSEIEKFEAFLKAQLAQQQTQLIAQQQQQQQQAKPTLKPTIHHHSGLHSSQSSPSQVSASQTIASQIPPTIVKSSSSEVNQHSSQSSQAIDVSLNVLSPQEPFMTPHVCGVKGSRRSSRIVGGSDSFPGEWCWQVALVNQHNKYICGGILIDKQWVLTAAHCITGMIRKGETFLVHVGQYDLTRPNRAPFKVLATFVHHNHNTQSLDNDIAILKLSSAAELSSDVCLVCLPTRANKRESKNERCTVTGYGYQFEAGPMALRVREASVPIVEDNECTTKINKVTERIFSLPASSFCAGGQGGNDACQGDGGSGLVCEDDGYYELAGLVSWGFGCGRPDVPGVYVKVSAFVGWINQIVSTNNH